MLNDPINAGEKDYHGARLEAEAANVDMVSVGGYHTEAGLITRQMRDQGVKTLLIGGDGVTDDEFAAITGHAGEGTLMTFSPDPRTIPIARAIVKKFRTQRKFEPQAYTLSQLCLRPGHQAGG